MTVATEYFNWQHAGHADPHYAKGPAPAMVDLREYIMKRYGGMDLGIYGVRPVVGGTEDSTHAFGAAWDWRYINPGIGRARMLNETMPFLINHSQELGIQMIGDYIGCRIWKAGRPGDDWLLQPKGSQMGQPWAAWLHIEIHPRVWSDGRPVEQKLGIQSFPQFDPAHGQFSLWPWSTTKPVIRLGSQGDAVRYCQGVMRKVGYVIAVDGGFGNLTKNIVIDYQRKRGLYVDGVVGPKTWAAIDTDAKR